MSIKTGFKQNIENLPPHWLSELLGSVQIEDERFSTDVLTSKANHAYQSLENNLNHLTEIKFTELIQKDVEPDQYITRVNNITEQWNKGDAPSLSSIAWSVLNHLNIDPNARQETPEVQMAKAILTHAIVADVDHNNPYHWNGHFRDAVIDSMRLASQCALDHHDTLLLLWSAIKHDEGHRGFVGNRMPNVMGEHTPLLEEVYAQDIAELYERALGIDPELIADSRVIVFSSDVSGEEQAPAMIVDDLYDHYFPSNLEKVPAMPDLQNWNETARNAMARLVDRPDLIHIGKILRAGDLFSGVARGHDLAVSYSARLTTEINGKLNVKSPTPIIIDPENEINFRNTPIIQRLFALPEMKPFQPHFESMMEKFKTDKENSVVYSVENNFLQKFIPQPKPGIA